MAILHRPRQIMGAVIIGSLLVLAAAPVNAVKIPERGYVPAGITSVVHVRVDSGCGSEPTDRLEVSIPEGLSQVVPEAIPGWVVEIETTPSKTADSADSERVSLIRWSGGSLPDGQYMDFGFRALFPDEPDTVLTFPVVQGCGSLERVQSGVDGEGQAPLVNVGKALVPQDLVALADSVDELIAQVGSIQEQVGQVRSPVLRDRVDDVESAGVDLTERFVNLRDRIKVIEDLLASESVTGPAAE